MKFLQKKESVIKKTITAVLFLGVVVVNALATLLPINGKATGAISDAYPNLFAPAGVTFSIWSVIYLLLAGYCVYQFNVVRGKQSKVKESTIDTVNTYVIANAVLNMAWIFAWHYEIMWLTVVLMVGLLYTLIRINLLLKDVAMNGQDRWLIRAPFSIYFGWITVATVANITTWLVSIQWDGAGLSQGTWMVAILIVAAIIGGVTTVRQRDWLYGSVIVWAFAGILVKHLSPAGWNGMYPSVLAALYIILPVLIVLVVQQLKAEQSTR